MIVSRVHGSILLLLVVLAVGCAPKASNEPKLTITFPSASSMTAQSKGDVSAMTYSWATVCYIVNVTGPGINDLKANSCEIPTGVFKGSVPPGGKLELEVPRGANRRIEVFGYTRASASEPCPALAGGFGTTNRARVSLVGTVENVSIQKAEEEVTVQLISPTAGDALIAKFSLAASCLPSLNAAKSGGRISQGRAIQSGTNLKVEHSVSFSPSEKEFTGTNLKIRTNARGQ